MLIKDRYNTVIQRQETSGSITTAYNRYGSVVGKYDSQTNRTYDRHGVLIGYGNLLSSLS